MDEKLGVPPWIGNPHIRHTMQIATHYTTSMRWQISSYSWNSPLSDTTRRGALGWQGKIDGDGELEKTSISQWIFRMATRWYKNRWRPLQIVFHRTAGPAWDGFLLRHCAQGDPWGQHKLRSSPQEDAGWQWMAAASLFERQTSSLNCLNLQQRIRTGQGVQGSSCFSRTSSRALSRKSTRRTANFWMWEPQTSERLFPGAVTVGSQALQAGLQFHTFSMTGVAKPSGWIRGRQVQGATNSTAEIGEMLHTLCLLVHFYCCTLAWHFVSPLRLCQLLKAHEEQLLQLRSAQVWLHPTPILSCHHVAKIVEEPWPWFAMRKFQRRFCPCFLCLRFATLSILALWYSPLRNKLWETGGQSMTRCQDWTRRSQSFAMAKNCRRGLQPAEIRWLEVWRSFAPAGRRANRFPKVLLDLVVMVVLMLVSMV